MTTPHPTCSTCRHWDCWNVGDKHDRKRPVIGTCAKGGLTPEGGCSDTHRDEFCEKYERKD